MTTINEAEDLISRAINDIVDTSPSSQVLRGVLNLALEGTKVPSLVDVDCSVIDVLTAVHKQHVCSPTAQLKSPGTLVSLSNSTEVMKAVRIHICADPDTVPVRVSTTINLNDVTLFVVSCVEKMLTVSLYQINMGNPKPVRPPILAHLWDGAGWVISTRESQSTDTTQLILFDINRLVEGLHIFHALHHWCNIGHYRTTPPTFSADRVNAALSFAIRSQTPNQNRTDDLN